jgi:hypothetical protein
MNATDIENARGKVSEYVREIWTRNLREDQKRANDEAHQRQQSKIKMERKKAHETNHNDR